MGERSSKKAQDSTGKTAEKAKEEEIKITDYTSKIWEMEDGVTKDEAGAMTLIG